MEQWILTLETVNYNDQERARDSLFCLKWNVLHLWRSWKWAQDFRWRPSWVLLQNFTSHKNIAVWSISIISINKIYIRRYFNLVI